jgi:hypothetical protein
MTFVWIAFALAVLTVAAGAIRWRQIHAAQRSPVMPSACATAFSKALHRPGVIYYRTKDGLADYGFLIERQADGFYRAYIVSQPSYGSRDANLHATHRLPDGSRYYVCWTGRLKTEQQARQVAALWADATQKYIKHGRTF